MRGEKSFKSSFSEPRDERSAELEGLRLGLKKVDFITDSSRVNHYEKPPFGDHYLQIITRFVYMIMIIVIKPPFVYPLGFGEYFSFFQPPNSRKSKMIKEYVTACHYKLR